MWTWLQATSTAVHDAANLAVILDPLALLKRRSSIRTYLCHLALHRCGGQEVNGLTCAGSWNHWVLTQNGKSACAFTIPDSTLGLKGKDHSCYRRCSVGWPCDTGWQISKIKLEGKNFAIRPQQGKKADSFNSDHSLVVQVIHMTSCASISNGRSSSNAPLMSRFSPGDRMRNERRPLCPVCCHLCRDQHEISAGKKQNINPMWKVLVKEVDLGEPTSFLDHVYFGCTMRPETNSNYFGGFWN